MKNQWIQIGHRYLNVYNIIEIINFDDEICIRMREWDDENQWFFTEKNTPVEFKDLKKFLSENRLDALIITTEDDVE